jgi:hypothetical protein
MEEALKMFRPTSFFLAITAPFLIVSAFAQQTSPSGFGRILFPGTGGPTAPPRGLAPGLIGNTAPGGFGRIVYPGTGAPVAIRPGVPGNPVFVAPGGIAPGGRGPIRHPAHSRATYIPFPVFYGDPYASYGIYDVPPAATPDTEYDPSMPNQRPPVVIINQNFQPDTVSSNGSPSAIGRPSPRQPELAERPAPQIIPRTDVQVAQEEPTIYLIAMTDSTVFDALGYWVEGDTLAYITPESSLNRVSLGLVDRDRSMKLNQERNVEFKLPKR